MLRVASLSRGEANRAEEATVELRHEKYKLLNKIFYENKAELSVWNVFERVIEMMRSGMVCRLCRLVSPLSSYPCLIRFALDRRGASGASWWLPAWTRVEMSALKAAGRPTIR